MRSFGILALLFTSAAAFGDRVDDYIAKKMSEDHLPGVGFSIILPNGKIETRTYGLSRIETEEEFSPKSVHRIASLSKQICSYVALKLVQENRLSLDDEVLKWFPKGSPQWKGMKVRHLMSHTSGIADPEGFLYSKEYTQEEYLALLSKAKLESEPGTKFRYNNYAYGLLGELVGLAGGEPLPELAKRHIFNVVGMENTSYYLPEEKISHEVYAYYWENEKYVPAQRIRPRVFHGSGGIRSTLEDMVLYDLAMRNGKLDSKILAQQWTIQFPDLSRYGFGWYKDETSVRHTGTTFGFTSAFYREIPSGYSIILFRNSNTGSQMEMALEILRIFKDEVQAQSKH